MVLSFIAKNYLNSGSHSILNEPIVVPTTDDAVYFVHDNISSLTIYTGLNSTLVQITDFSISNSPSTPWVQILHFGSTTRTTYSGITVYANYTTTGDVCDSSMINRLEQELERHEAEDPHNTNSGNPTQVASVVPANNGTDISTTSTVTVNFNKWLDDSQESKLKVYSDSGRTAEVSGTVVRTDDKVLTWSVSSPMNTLTLYYPRIISGVKGVDGVLLSENYDWSFQTEMASNQAPTATVQTTTGTTTLGSVLTGHYTYSDNESDLEGTSTFKWYRGTLSNGSNKSVITGATASTYTLVEADIGLYNFFEVTPVAQTGTITGTPVVSAGLNIPVPAPPAILVSASNTQNSISFTANSTLSTETYDLYWSTTETVASNIKANGTKITGVTSPVTHSTLTNGTQYNYVLTMTENSVESSPSSVVSGTPSDIVLAPTGTVTKSASNPLFAPDATYDVIGDPSIYYDATSDKYYLVHSARTQTTGVTDSLLMRTCLGSADPTVLANWTAYSKILAKGSSGFDSASIVTPCIYRDTVGTWYLYYAGSGGVNLSIGYATCPNGSDPMVLANWTKAGTTAVLSRGDAAQWDDNGVQSPLIYKDGSTYYMYYTGNNSSNVYKIGVATASSLSGTWTKSGTNPIFAADAGTPWRANRVYSNHGGLVKVGSTYYMFVRGYNSSTIANSGLGLISSTSLTSGWTEESGNPKIAVGASGQWDDDWTSNGSMTVKNDKYVLVYAGRDLSTNPLKIGVATIPRY